MSFREIRLLAIQAIAEGRIQHEARNEINEKNLLLIGALTPEQVIQLLRTCRGDQYFSSPHHFDPEIWIHVFTPEYRFEPKLGRKKEKWYIKLYFVDLVYLAYKDVWFISVHKSTREAKT